jgi:inosine-uridine nucleoside N-ribohydrolase
LPFQRLRLKHVIIDTDPGIDDAAAILLALASPDLCVEAITTVYGNGPVEVCTANALRILHAAGRTDIPVHQGVGKPLLRQPNPGWASQVHGADALGNTSFPLPPNPPIFPPNQGETAGGPTRRHAVLEIIDRVMASPGQISLLALGRLTNLALALTLEPRLAGSVAQIIVMGGAVRVPGNVSPVASANLYEDPEAASLVYASGAPLVQVGLDVCDQVAVSQEQLNRIGQTNTAPARLLSAATPCLQSYYRSRGLLTGAGGVRYNDLPAVAFAIDPSLFGAQDLYVAIETQSPLARGQTVADLRNTTRHPPNVRVCLEVDAARLAALFTQRLADYLPAPSPPL